MYNVLSGIDPKKVETEYKSRDLDQLTDHQLFGLIAENVSEPTENGSSFTMHAPLQLLARKRLLPFVKPDERRMARMQMVSLCARYQAQGPTIAPPQQLIDLPNRWNAIDQLQSAITEGDVERADCLCVSMCRQFDYQVLLEAIVGKSIRTLACAAHAHIGVHNLTAMGAEGGDSSLKLIREMIRGFAQDTDVMIQDEFFDLVELETGGSNPEVDILSIESELGDAIDHLPRLRQKLESLAIRNVVQVGEEAQLLKDFLPRIPPMSKEQLNQVLLNLTLNTAVQSMLQENTEFSKYGWTHCLNLPQAAWSLSPIIPEDIQMPLVTLSWVLGFRAALSQADFSYHFEPPKVSGSFSEALHSSPSDAASVAWHTAPEHRLDMVTEIATQASIRRDAHLVKYVRACIDGCWMNPQKAHLYLAGAAYLTSLWMSEHQNQSLMSILNET